MWPAAAKLNGQVVGYDVSVSFIDQSYDPRSRHYFRNIRGADLTTELSGSELFCSRRPYFR